MAAKKPSTQSQTPPPTPGEWTCSTCGNVTAYMVCPVDGTSKEKHAHV